MGTAETASSVHLASSPAARPGRAELVAAELVRSQFRNIPTAIAVNAIISVLLCVALRETVSAERLLWWLGAVYLIAAARLLMWRVFMVGDPLRASLPAAYEHQGRPLYIAAVRWRGLAFLGSGVNGLTWGLGGILLYAPDSPAAQFLLLITQFGMGAGAVYVSAPSFAAVLAYLFPSVVLSAVPFLLEGDSVHLTLGAMLFVFIAAATHFTYGISRTIARAIELRFENIELIHELRDQKAAAEAAREAAEEANVAKSRFLAAAGHDLRQPMQALSFFVDALHEQALPDLGGRGSQRGCRGGQRREVTIFGRRGPRLASADAGTEFFRGCAARAGIARDRRPRQPERLQRRPTSRSHDFWPPRATTCVSRCRH